ncbi:MAG: hypothetical protein ACLFQ5_08880 [Oceanicaulis sp.]
MRGTKKMPVMAKTERDGLARSTPAARTDGLTLKGDVRQNVDRHSITMTDE